MNRRNHFIMHYSRVGLILFGVYLVLYSGFVLLAAYSPDTMERTPLAGVNLAIWYGFGLIAVAILLAVIYGLLCGLRSTGSKADASRGRSTT